MTRNLRRPALVWLFTMAFTGIGSTMLGSFLPQLLIEWQITDQQAGMLIAALFLGSFTGTLSMAQELGHCVRRGSWTAAIGCAGFAIATEFARAFPLAVLALLVMGFGLGQLMSSINLLVGKTPAENRSSALAIVGAFWCAGAVLSPSVSTVLLKGFSPGSRLLVLAILFLLPLTGLSRASAVSSSPAPAIDTGPRLGALSFTCMFIIYGGIEASASAWIPLFATRYAAGRIATSQWLLSLFWSGLIAGRLLLSAFVAPSREQVLFRVSVVASALSLAMVLSSHAFVHIAIASAALGICLSPLFPLLLSMALSRGYSHRTMGMMLAACALGSGLLPLLLGIVSNSFSLRAGMYLPVAGLLVLISLQEHSRYMKLLKPTRIEAGSHR